MDIFTYDPMKKKDVKAGEFNLPSRSFSRTVKSNHFVVMFQGYGLQKEVVDKLVSLGCETVKLRRKDGWYESKLSEWTGYNLLRNLGHGLQYFLPVRNMSYVLRRRNPNADSVFRQQVSN